MKAFTYLCAEVNFSLFDDTLTLYPKPNSYHHKALMVRMCDEEGGGCETDEVKGADDIFEDRSVELGVKRYVLRFEPEHSRYHMDNFSMDLPHVHAQFPKTIDLPKLRQILHTCVKYKIVSSGEEAGFIEAYEQANKLEPDSLKTKAPDLPPITGLKSPLPRFSIFPASGLAATLPSSIEPVLHDSMVLLSSSA